MNKEDYYFILGIKQDATGSEIKRAYKKLAMKYHPDRNKGDGTTEEKFKKIGEAYEILSNPQKRQTYDQYGHSGINQSYSSYSTSHFTDIFGDIFGDIFEEYTGRKKRSYQRKGSDLLHIIKLKLEDAATGIDTKLRINTQITCQKCKGSGANSISDFINCNTCEGKGQIRLQQGFIIIQQTCNKCNGSGHTIRNICKNCYGKGRIRSEKVLSAKIPPGIDNNDKIKLSNEGEAGLKGGPPGDLYIQVIVTKHEIFTRNDSNLYCEVPISFCTAVLGGNLEIPTLQGKISIKIPPETQTNKIFRLKNKGIKNIRNHIYGDLLCKVIIETPINLKQKQKEMLHEFDNNIKENEKYNPKRDTWLKSVRKFLKNINIL